MENLMFLILGIVISVLGIINIKGDVSTIHSYNRRNVAETDVPKYGKVVGTGTLIIGGSLIAACLLSFLYEKAIAFVVLSAAITGMAFILYGQIKYNHGIF